MPETYQVLTILTQQESGVIKNVINLNGSFFIFSYPLPITNLAPIQVCDLVFHRTSPIVQEMGKVRLPLEVRGRLYLDCCGPPHVSSGPSPGGPSATVAIPPPNVLFDRLRVGRKPQ